MLELLLLRHAEALRAGADGRDHDRPDHDRPLSARGIAQARGVGTWLAAQGAAPDAVLCSSARRARMTAIEVCGVLPIPEPRLFDLIYQATPGQLLGLIAEQAGDARQVLLVGHNPAITQLLALLVGAGARDMSPASLAWIAFAGVAPEPGHGRLRQFRAP